MIKSFGTLQRDNKHWAIRCEPHVRTRFKRIFSQVRQHASEVIQLTDTLVNCHELAWFIERFVGLDEENTSSLMNRAAATRAAIFDDDVLVK